VLGSQPLLTNGERTLVERLGLRILGMLNEVIPCLIKEPGCFRKCKDIKKIRVIIPKGNKHLF
jgi:hypothetical protein